MSRHTIQKDNGISVSFGLDHAVGYFVQVLDETKDGLDEVVVDLDYLNSNKGEIVEKMTELGLPEEIIENVVLDLPI